LKVRRRENLNVGIPSKESDLDRYRESRSTQVSKWTRQFKVFGLELFRPDKVAYICDDRDVVEDNIRY